MPITPTYPGVYVQEVPSSDRTITGVSTSITAFIGRAKKGPVCRATTIHSFGDYIRLFGRLWNKSTMSYAVYHYFLNGGMDAVIVRVYRPAGEEIPGKAIFTVEGKRWIFEAANQGEWGKNLDLTIDHKVSRKKFENDKTLFNLAIEDKETGSRELFSNVSANGDNPRFIKTLLEEESGLLRINDEIQVPETRPPQSTTKDHSDLDKKITLTEESFNDGLYLDSSDITGNENKKSGIFALDNVDFNLLCIPPFNEEENFGNMFPSVLRYCEKRRAIFIVDPPKNWKNKDDPQDQTNYGIDSPNFEPKRHKNAAIYFPRIRATDPLEEYRIKEFVPCGVVAGVIVRTDSERGVWKAPAGIEACIRGVTGFTVQLTDKENGELNPLGINCLRNLPVVGPVVWGARTMRGADRLADQWKYLPVRRLALYIEESLYRGTQWVVFEPNDENLWSQIRLSVGAFLHGLFRQGAFQGTSPKQAFFVKCDKETTTQYDINRSIVNIIVGFAPLKPAEFIILKIQQIAGQEQS